MLAKLVAFSRSSCQSSVALVVNIRTETLQPPAGRPIVSLKWFDSGGGQMAGIENETNLGKVGSS